MKKKKEKLPQAVPAEYKLLKKRTKVLLQVLLVACTALMLFSGYQAFINTSDVPRNRDVTRYRDILTEAEQEDWTGKGIQKGEAVFQLNLEIPVDAAGSQADIRLVHPPYSDFICKVRLKDMESGIILYESGEMIPGTLLQYITLSETMAVGKYDAVAEYTFMDGKGKVHGTYDVKVVLDVKEEGVSERIHNPYEEFQESET